MMTVSDFEEASARAGRSGATGGSHGPGRGFDAEGLVDELVPDGVDWERLVRTYPVPALVAVAGAGFWLGVRKGSVVWAALSGLAAREMTRQVHRFLGDDVL